MFDLVFSNATIIDGTGAPRKKGSIGIRNGKIYDTHPNAAALRTIDAAGKILSPGFIDAHSHGDTVVGNDYARECKTTQGITTEIAGMCGTTFFPYIPNPQGNPNVAPTAPQNLFQAKDQFSSGKGFFDFVEKCEKSCNIALFTGHNALRKACMGYSDQKPTPDQMEQMKGLLDASMEQGSLGLSTGLFYPPSGYADTDEIAELCGIVAKHGGIHTSHIRDEAANVEKSVDEIIEIAQRSGVQSNISHHKICGQSLWGTSARTLQKIHDANQNGQQITLDQYPYTASYTALSACLPLYCFADGTESLLEKLKDSSYRAMIKEQLTGDDPAFDGRYRQCGGFEHIMIGISAFVPEAEGLLISEYAAKINKDVFDTFFDLLVENKLTACYAIYFSMSDEDLFRIVQSPYCMIGSDGIVASLHGATHPRGWGSFPRAIRLFVREQQLMTLEAMIHKMTDQVAQTYHLKKRGRIADGFEADLVLFDEDTISDCNTYAKSTLRCTGIDMVVVNGEIVFENGTMTGHYPGRFLPFQPHTT